MSRVSASRQWSGRERFSLRDDPLGCADFADHGCVAMSSAPGEELDPGAQPVDRALATGLERVRALGHLEEQLLQNVCVLLSPPLAERFARLREELRPSTSATRRSVLRVTGAVQSA